MLIDLLLLIDPAPSWAEANFTADPYEMRRETCTGWMMSAYPSGLEEAWCTSEFGLPSAFLFQCASAQRAGYKTETQREACRIMFLKAARNAASGYVLNRALTPRAD